MRLPLLLLLSAPAATALSAAPADLGGSRHFGRAFLSPMGEPFSTDRGGDALALWFNQADRDHDGSIVVGEMQADAERFFASLDVNHDGEIDPDELDRYEKVVAPDDPAVRLELVEGVPPKDIGHHRGGGGGPLGSGSQGRARYGLLDLREPVIAADTNFNRGVSLEEFREAATKRFAALDVDHQGRLTLDVLESLRPPPPPARKSAPPQMDGESYTDGQR